MRRSSSLRPQLCVLRDEQEAYLAGLGTVGMEMYEQVPKLDAVVVPVSGHFGLLAGTATALKHLNSRILVVVSLVSLFAYCSLFGFDLVAVFAISSLINGYMMSWFTGMGYK